MKDKEADAIAYVVESIPKGLEDLRGIPGVQYTEDVLVRLTNATRSTLDLTAMYWALLPDPMSIDEEGFSNEQFEEMGAEVGRDLYEALCAAADRGVRIRILQSPGFSKEENGSTPKQESDKLKDQYPDCVSIHPIEMGKWYGGSGIMHQKIWIFDKCHLYIGSANMDWKSIAQVKEMGVAVENCPALADDTRRYFEAWCTFSAIEPNNFKAFDATARIERSVPLWSKMVPEDQRITSPLVGEEYATPYNHQNPQQLSLNEEIGGVFLTGCPNELCGEGRSWDGDGLVFTIDDAQSSVCVSVMDFAPISLYGRQNDDGSPSNTPLWWPSLFDALLRAVLTRKVHVRLLVSKWAHTSGLIEPFLRALQQAADGGRASKYMTAGQLEIKQFIIPGWDSTNGINRKYPGHTRVNHTKYIVTDRRVNIGTSNMTWDYFTSTAGCSFNADHPALVHTLQSVFDRDWASSYAYRLI